MEISIKLIESILIPKILYGCETWTNVSKQQLKILEKIPKDAVTVEAQKGDIIVAVGNIFHGSIKSYEQKLNTIK